ncbi:MAG: amino acid adenylation domain-containing protein [Caldilineaceae bacterium]|nr:amino acid adenylation domain-containing protein [Caldilineaceae bacterium]
MSILEQRIANLSPEKRALLEQHLLAKASKSKTHTTIPRRQPAESYPLSFAQERMWFLEQLYPDSALYNEQNAFRLKGSLNVEALKQSIQIIVQRHEGLRTVYKQIDGKPAQVILAEVSVDLPLIDLSHLSPEDQEPEILRLAGLEAQRPFDLTTGPVYRSTLLRLADDEHVFIQTRHHIATDGWSTGIYRRELSDLYNAYCEGRTPSLPELPIQYADFALWQRQWLEGELGRQQLEYWRKQLADLSPLDLPTDRPRTSTPAHHGGSYFFTLPADLTRALKELSRHEKATLYMVLLTAFQILLHRYSGQHDIAVGSPIANRTRAEMEGLLGFFVNTFVMRSDLADNPTFRDLLARVQRTSLDAYAHQDLPFEKIVEDLQPERHLDRHPLFQVVFVLQNAPRNMFQLSGITWERILLPIHASKFDLMLSLSEDSDLLQGHMQYNADLFDHSTIERMLSHFQTLLQGIVVDPDCPIGLLPLMTDVERRQILVEWNDTAIDYPTQPPLHQLFETHVEKTPDKVAVIDGEKRWTYQQLDQKAEAIASALRRLNIGPGEIVAICCDRSLDMVAGVLGIIKIGAAYLPLDSSYPVERLQFMLADSAASGLLTTSALQPKLTVENVSLLLLDQIIDAPDRSNLQPLPSISMDSTAYVMYTSGSTGFPKGVVIPQRAIIRLVLNTNYVTLTPADVIAQASNFSFDAATFEIWGTLLNGATLVILDQDTILSPKHLAEQIRQKGITTLFITTALFNQIALDHPQAFQPLRTLLFGGEAVDPTSVARVLRHGAPARLLHVYGPTETTTFASWHLVESLDDGATTVPIGQPVANTQLYVLDANQQPLPVGIPGELYIGGDGLASGYLNRREQTEKRFVTVDLPLLGPRRLYRTGDRVCYRDGGVIEFLGRLDNQVKIRGYRIEPGEIESVLQQHPGVHKAVVLVRNDEYGQKQLVAYAVADPGITVESLRLFLQNRLPAYMIPSALMLLETLPLTQNGKIDSQQLLAMQPAFKERSESTIEVRDLLDAQMKGLWESLLNVRPIALDDNFFELGGHSLLAVNLFAEIERLMGKRLPLSILFQAPTLRQLTDAIRDQDWVSPWKSLVAVQPKGHKRPLFLVPPAATTALRFAFLVSHLGTDRPMYSFDSLGLDGMATPHTSIEEMAADYLREMRLVQPTGPYLLGGMCMGAHIALEMAQQLQTAGQEVSSLVILDAGLPRNGPSWRVPTRTRFHYLRRLIHHVQRNTVISEMILPRVNQLLRRSVNTIDPVRRRMQQVKDVQNRAWYRYVARPYSGHVVLFQSEMYHARGDHLRWAEIFPKMNLYVTPGTTHRDLLLTEPYIGQWAAQLAQCLNQTEEG